MKSFFKKIFGDKKTRENTEPEQPLTDNDRFDILANAICDVGHWNWWAAELPAKMQLEFTATQLYFPPKADNQPPPSQIAIQFRNLKSVSFLSTRQNGLVDNQKWFDLLHNDKLEIPSCNFGEYTFTDEELMKKLLNQSKTIDTVHGYSPCDTQFFAEKHKLVFYAQDYGLSISADEILIFTADRDITLKEIPEINSQWWQYWRKYHDMLQTPTPLPKDFVCDVTIPLKND